jgi:hypothetical protein
MTIVRKGAALAIAGLGAVAIAALSRVPSTPSEPAEALLRLSWRIMAARVEVCRPRTAEELAALAPHMRTPEACTGGPVDYALRVEIDGREVVRDTLRAAGVRGDRPLTVQRDLHLDPGRYELEIEFDALVPEGRDAGDAPTEFELESEVELASRQIALVTLDESERALEVR